jgi:hypothetical protein
MKMHLDKKTIDLLKNYSLINSNLLIREGSLLSTISAQKNIFAETELDVSFPVDFGIYDLVEFLGVLSLFDDSYLEFTDSEVTISDGKSKHKIVYRAADSSMLTVPSKKINFPKTDLQFVLTADMLSRIKKTSSVLRCNDIKIYSQGRKVILSVLDKKNPSCNYCDFELDTEQLSTTPDLEEFSVYFLVDNLKIMPYDYTVDISSKKISRFTAKNSSKELVYYIAVEADSSF